MNMYKFLKRLGAKHTWCRRDMEYFIDVAGDTAVRLDEKGNRYIRDLGRGLFLNSLVLHFKPKRIFEIGTGRGYSGVCMVEALRKLEYPDHYFCTLDSRNANMKFDYLSMSGEKLFLSTKELMLKHLAYLDDVCFLTGKSSVIMPDAITQSFRSFDFIFVDGAHDAGSVALDAAMVVKWVANDNAVIVFHDYQCDVTPEVGPGVDKAIEKGVLNSYELFPISTDGGVNGSTYIYNNKMGSLVAIPKHILPASLISKPEVKDDNAK